MANSSFATTPILQNLNGDSSTESEERKVSLFEIIEEPAYGNMRDDGLGDLRRRGCSSKSSVQRDWPKKYTLT